MKYEKTVTGIFVDRPNRFIAHVQIENQLQTVHVKNTGRCKELLLPGSTVILEDFRNRPGYESRKTQFDLIAVYKELSQDNPLCKTQEKTENKTQITNKTKVLINMDSQAPNKVVLEWLKTFLRFHKTRIHLRKLPRRFLHGKKIWFSNSKISYGSKRMHLRKKWNRIFSRRTNRTRR